MLGKAGASYVSICAELLHDLATPPGTGQIAETESLKEYGLRRVLEDILIMEEEHRRDLLTVLRN
jgi:hypothetical protein